MKTIKVVAAVICDSFQTKTCRQAGSMVYPITIQTQRNLRRCVFSYGKYVDHK